MPAILDKCIATMMKQGKSRESAFAICTMSLQKAGMLKTGTQDTTKKGAKRNQQLNKKK